ncbi:MAG: threonylcarbamoyl-AMP synthase [Candidatus Staskawiczbacteria bacterium]|nr:threonylcarbamoyl-AMP synthase [Candidatus Staskawiczbacteria bacterium]MBI3337463.1 threonylcarbamoyl-AMP synthase [Candidatus Staskawiczbacteria bacterium]
MKKALLTLKNGGVVVCPTDTVYGFLADATNKKAVDTIFKIKKRLRSKPLSIFVKDFKMAEEIAFISENQKKIIKKHWPGKHTFILKRKSDINLYGVQKDTIAIRIPKYKFLNNLLKKINTPLVQTSVNISGEPPLTKIEDIVKEFGRNKNIFIINAGSLKKAKPSKIIDLTGKNKKVLRK